jgi:hypothetical protein
MVTSPSPSADDRGVAFNGRALLAPGAVDAEGGAGWPGLVARRIIDIALPEGEEARRLVAVPLAVIGAVSATIDK